MNINEMLKRFETKHPDSVVGSYCQYGKGLLVVPMTKNTYEPYTGVYFYFKDEKDVGKFVGIPAEKAWELKPILVRESSNDKLLKLASEAEALLPTREKKIEYINANAPKHLLEYLKTDIGKHFLELYVK